MPLRQSPAASTGDDFHFSDAAGRPAAVLIPLVDREGELRVVLTRRHDQLKHHAGQISFPGGSRDDEDADLLATALRETEEEIGVPTRLVRVMGRLERYRTGTGFDVAPFVGEIDANVELVRQEVEVAEIFEVPLAFLLDDDNHAERHGFFRGRNRRYYEIVYEHYRIWGATAGMIINLAQRVRRVDAAN